MKVIFLFLAGLLAALPAFGLKWRAAMGGTGVNKR